VVVALLLLLCGGRLSLYRPALFLALIGHSSPPRAATAAHTARTPLAFFRGPPPPAAASGRPE
jgi:hypothetical protein